MKTEELVEWLEDRPMTLDTSYNEDEKIKDEIIKRLEELEELKVRLNSIRLCVDELIEERKRIKQLLKV